jgi:hypothetical protein
VNSAIGEGTTQKVGLGAVTGLWAGLIGGISPGCTVQHGQARALSCGMARTLQHPQRLVSEAGYHWQRECLRIRFGGGACIRQSMRTADPDAQANEPIQLLQAMVMHTVLFHLPNLSTPHAQDHSEVSNQLYALSCWRQWS